MRFDDGILQPFFCMKLSNLISNESNDIERCHDGSTERIGERSLYTAQSI